MEKKRRASNGTEKAMAERFGHLSLTMLNDTPLSHVWRLSFLANFFTGPIYRELEERFKLSRPEFVILFSLSQQPGLVARDVCLVTGLPKNSISRAVSELVSKRLVKRETAAGDKRAKVLTLTAAGRKALKQAVPLFEVRQEAMRAALTRKEMATFDRLLEKIVFAVPNWVGSD